jgi:hypothetical protein
MRLRTLSLITFLIVSPIGTAGGVEQNAVRGLASNDYGVALDKAREAALIQSGVMDKVNRAKAYGEKESLKVAKDLGVDKPLGVALYLGKVYRDREVSIRITNAVRLSATPNGGGLVITF